MTTTITTSSNTVTVYCRGGRTYRRMFNQDYPTEPTGFVICDATCGPNGEPDSGCPHIEEEDVD